MTEFLNVVDECHTLLRQRGNYYRELEKQTKDEESIKSSLPSREEIRMMQERWTTFSTSIEGLQDGFGALFNRIHRGASIRRVDSSYDNPQSSGNAAPTSSSDPTDAPNGRKAVLGSSTPGSPPSTKRKTSVWSSLLRRLFSCLTLKYFSKR